MIGRINEENNTIIDNYKKVVQKRRVAITIISKDLKTHEE